MTQKHIILAFSFEGFGDYEMVFWTNSHPLELSFVYLTFKLWQIDECQTFHFTGNLYPDTHTFKGNIIYCNPLFSKAHFYKQKPSDYPRDVTQFIISYGCHSYSFCSLHIIQFDAQFRNKCREERVRCFQNLMLLTLNTYNFWAFLTNS